MKATLLCAAKSKHDNRNTAAGTVEIELPQKIALKTAQAIVDVDTDSIPDSVAIPDNLGWGHPVTICYASGKARTIS